MRVRSVHDRDELATLLQPDPHLYAYHLGDLDDFFWPYTTWYRLGDLVALIYHGADPPTLLALAPTGRTAQLRELIENVRPLLPRRFYAHVSPGLGSTMDSAVTHGPHLKLALTRPSVAGPDHEVLGPADRDELTRLYDAAYPGNWFDARMLETGQYVGVRRDGRLVGVAGVHVWSPAYRVAAIGNVATHPSVRGQGLATTAVAALCRRLAETVDHITLNVKADNAAALTVYTRLGFTVTAEYEELMVSG